jgi:hypothetical protein
VGHVHAKRGHVSVAPILSVSGAVWVPPPSCG